MQIKKRYRKVGDSMLRVFEGFSGYGSQGIGLQRYKIPYISVGIAEINMFAIEAYYRLHYRAKSCSVTYPSMQSMLTYLEERNIGYDAKKGCTPWKKYFKKTEYTEKENKYVRYWYKLNKRLKNQGDIRRIDPKALPDMDLFTYSFPCQDISTIGQGKGLEEGSGTRSALLWECRKVIVEKKPTYLLLENVRELVGKKNKGPFLSWLSLLTKCGYNNYWKVVDAAECGIPQRRKRVFCVSILKTEDHGKFQFLESVPLTTTMQDMLESEVDTKYYLSKKMKDYALCKGTQGFRAGVAVNKKVARPILATVFKMHRAGVDNYISNAELTGLKEGGDEYIKRVKEGKLRRLTPRECFRLMGLEDKEIDKLQRPGTQVQLSDTQLYKLAGNGIEINSLSFLAEMFKKR